MGEKTEQSGPQPLLAIIAAAVLALSLFTPYLLMTIPVMVTVGLAIASGFRKERPTWLPYGVAGAAILFLLSTHARDFAGLFAPSEVKASAIYADATWQYGETKDEMRETVTKDATLNSPTDLDLPAPYDGTNVASIYVNSSPGIMLSVSKGQFQCYSDTTVAVKIDHGLIHDYPCSNSVSGQSNFLFINTQDAIYEGQHDDPKDLLATGKQMAIEASFFGAGTRRIVFNIAGFNPAKLK